jgi:hypothetical protein
MILLAGQSGNELTRLIGVGENKVKEGNVVGHSHLSEIKKSHKRS